MRYITVLIYLLLASCGVMEQKGSKTSAEILQSLKPLPLPFTTENLPRDESWHEKEIEALKLTALAPENVHAMQLRLRDSVDQPSDEPPSQLPDAYWFSGKIGEPKNYKTVVVGSSTHMIRYCLITFTAEGQIIDKLVISEKTGGEGQVYDMESTIDKNGNIIVRKSNIYTEPNDVLGITWETSYRIDDTGKFIKGDVKQSYKETEVDWYAIPDEGLLSVEKARGNSIHFSLTVGRGENCTGGVSGEAFLQPDGKNYTYQLAGNSPCTVIFKPATDVITLEETEDQGCEHGVNCPFSGTYKKIATEKFSGVPSVRFWPRNSLEEFTCMLKKTFAYEDSQYKCGAKPFEKYDPRDSTWNAGPEFPTSKVKMIHPLVNNIELVWEHGEIQELTIYFEKEMSVQSIKRMFNLPHSEEDRSTYYENIQTVNYDNFTEDDVRVSDLKLLLVKSVTLTGFEHMGAGDIDLEDESINK